MLQFHEQGLFGKSARNRAAGAGRDIRFLRKRRAEEPCQRRGFRRGQRARAGIAGRRLGGCLLDRTQHRLATFKLYFRNLLQRPAALRPGRLRQRAGRRAGGCEPAAELGKTRIGAGAQCSFHLFAHQKPCQQPAAVNQPLSGGRGMPRRAQSGHHGLFDFQKISRVHRRHVMLSGARLGGCAAIVSPASETLFRSSPWPRRHPAAR